MPRATAAIVRAADLMPDDEALQLQTGTFLLAAGQFEDARARADKVLARSQRNAPALVLRGQALMRLKDLAGASSSLRDAAESEPSQSWVFRSLGQVRMAQGDSRQAELAFKNAVSLDPASVDAQVALGTVFTWARQRLPEAEGALKKAASLAPDNGAVNYVVASFFRRTVAVQTLSRSSARPQETPESRAGRCCWPTITS